MKVCKQCSKEFEPKFKHNQNEFCSLRCYWDSKKGKPSPYPEGLVAGRGWNKGICGEASHSFGNKHCVGRIPWNRGKKWEDAQKRKIGESHKRNPSRYWLGKKRPPYKRGKPQPQTRGENNPNWKGGRSRDYKSHYNNLEYRNWRRAVFERDNYTCQQCGKRNCYLEPHHIKSWTKFPELRYEVSNGKTLCLDCHAAIDPYRRRLMRK